MNIRINLIRGARGDCGEMRKKDRKEKRELEREIGGRRRVERLLKKHAKIHTF